MLEKENEELLSQRDALDDEVGALKMAAMSISDAAAPAAQDVINELKVYKNNWPVSYAGTFAAVRRYVMDLCHSSPDWEKHRQFDRIQNVWCEHVSACEDMHGFEFYNIINSDGGIKGHCQICESCSLEDLRWIQERFMFIYGHVATMHETLEDAFEAEYLEVLKHFLKYEACDEAKGLACKSGTAAFKAFDKHCELCSICSLPVDHPEYYNDDFPMRYEMVVRYHVFLSAGDDDHAACLARGRSWGGFKADDMVADKAAVAGGGDS